MKNDQKKNMRYIKWFFKYSRVVVLKCKSNKLGSHKAKQVHDARWKPLSLWYLGMNKTK